MKTSASLSTSANEKIRKANAIAKGICLSKNCKYVDLYSLYADADDELPSSVTVDGVHITSRDYDRWYDAIRPLLYRFKPSVVIHRRPGPAVAVDAGTAGFEERDNDFDLFPVILPDEGPFVLSFRQTGFQY